MGHSKIIRNSAKCRKCGEEVESKTLHDFVKCKCGSIAVDGGKSYLKRSGNPEYFEDTSLYESDSETLGEIKDE